MSELLFTGLDGKNPVAFLASLGLLNAVSDANAGGTRPRLAWRGGGAYRPVLVDGPDKATLLELLVRDLQTFRTELAIDSLCYTKGTGQEHDLKAPPGEYAKYLRRLVESKSMRSLSFAAAFGTDVAKDNNGNTKPTALHFTAGQQQFLAMVHDLVEGVTAGDLDEALFGPWRYLRPLPVLQWDNAVARDYALRATNPSQDKKLGVPGADWLAFRGLPFIGVAPKDTEIVTTGCYGGWKNGTFRWPIWTVALPRPVVRGLLTSTDIKTAAPGVLKARGVEVVFEASIRRSDQGGYGSFAPARVAPPGSILQSARRAGRSGAK